MAWTSPMTAIPGTFLTAADWNTFIRDDLNETAAGKATATGRWFVTTGPNAIAQRAGAQATVITGSAQSTTSSAYTDLTTGGPTVTLTTGDKAIVMWSAEISNNTLNQYSIVSFDVTGDTTVDPIDSRAFMEQSAGGSINAGSATLIALTPGSNTFTLKYRVTGGTGTFNTRRLVVLGL